jgi:hypothetical protein
MSRISASSFDSIRNWLNSVSDSIIQIQNFFGFRTDSQDSSFNHIDIILWTSKMIINSSSRTYFMLSLSNQMNPLAHPPSPFISMNWKRWLCRAKAKERKIVYMYPMYFKSLMNSVWWNSDVIRFVLALYESTNRTITNAKNEHLMSCFYLIQK